ILVGLVNISYIIYLDNILIFLDNKKDYKRYIKKVLKYLYKVKLFINLKKYK
ncbi:hypothetical protein P171DRAFT_353228, partial [Karstenula rhodostoma CBS 690.94]